jgi:hypothetical protein
VSDLEARKASFKEAVSSFIMLDSERDRMIKVMQDFVNWSASMPKVFSLDDGEVDPSVVSFRHKQSGLVAWSASPKRAGGARLEIFAKSRKAFPEGMWDAVHEKAQGISSEPMAATGALRIPFAALKNSERRQKAKELILELVEGLAKKVS